VTRTRRCAALAAVILTVAGAGASSAAAQAPVIAPGQPETGIVRLSDERTLSRYAFARIGTPVHRTPSPFAPTVGRLRFQTEDGFAEPYLVLRATVDGHGRQWVQLRVPGRPNGRTGWVVRGALARYHVVHTHIRIDRSTLRAVLYRDGRPIWRSRIGVGTPTTPTPSGHYIVRERFRINKPGGIYGSYAFGTSAYSVLSDWPRGGVVGIHGTNAPGLIPGRPSHGCVRLRNSSILRLSKLMPVGTTVEII